MFWDLPYLDDLQAAVKGLNLHARLPSEVTGGHADVDAVQADYLRFLQSYAGVLLAGQHLKGREPVSDSALLHEDGHWRWNALGHITHLESKLVSNGVLGRLRDGGDRRVIGFADSRCFPCFGTTGAFARQN
jgi:hypothetical protein